MLTTVVVFSYNRAEYLQNACDSVRRHWPSARILIMDDHSDDRRTRSVLSREESCGSRVVRPSQGVSEEKRGGLYRNMREVWDSHLDTPFALFMQDDQQLVRPIDAVDESKLRAYFDHPDSAPFLDVHFPGNVAYALDVEILARHNTSNVSEYYEPESASFRLPTAEGLADTGLWDVCRARELGWRFQADESQNKAAGFALFGPLRCAAFPFLAFLPSPVSYRNRRITVTRRIYFAARAGLFPVDDIPQAQIEVMRAEIGIPATGAKYLRSTAYGGSAPWPALPLGDAPSWVSRLDVKEQVVRFWARWLWSRFATVFRAALPVKSR